MKPERWQRIRRICEDVLECEAGEREGFLARACAGDNSLRMEVESFLSGEKDGFIEIPAVEIAARRMAEDEMHRGGADLTGETFLHYRIAERIGVGGMGEVYRARDDRLKRDVAVKVLPNIFTNDPERLARFDREAILLGSLSHPNVATVYGVEQDRTKRFLVLELVEGETLAQRLAQGPVPLGEALQICRQIAEGLEAAHEKGIIHRDLKPTNIKVTPQGRVKLLDFGLAKAIWGTEAKPDLSQWGIAAGPGSVAGHIVGTPGYMSPEQARGAEVDQRTDIWAFGCLLYELLAGKRAFAGETVSDAIAAVLEHEPDWQALPVEIPPKICDLVRQCLQKDAKQRLNNIADARTALEELQWEQIVAKAAEKDREVRSKSVRDLTVDLRGPMQDRDAGQMAAAISPVRKRVAKPLWAVLAAAVLLAALLLYLYLGRGQTIESLAVLPMVDASASTNIEYLSDGITESLIDSLSQLPKLRVMSRSSVFRYKGREPDPQAVGRELGVQAVLVSRLVERGDDLTISAELVDARDNTHIWGAQYNRKLTDVQAVQEEIGREITDKLRVKLTGEQKKSLARRQTQNSNAYQDYLKGRYYWNKRTAAGLKTAIEHLNTAIANDPAFALPYAGLADCYVLLSTFAAVPPRECFPKARTAALKALVIDETLGEAHAVVAEVKVLYDLDWAGAESEFRRAIELNPGYATAHQWYALCLARIGRFDKALAEIRRARELDPLSLIINTQIGNVFYYSRRYDQAIEQFRHTLAMDPTFEPARFNLSRSYAATQMYPEAIAELRAGIESAGENPRLVAGLAFACAASGKRAEAQKILNELLERSKRGYVHPNLIAVVYIGLGDKDLAFQWLDKAVEERGESVSWLKTDPLYDPLRSDRRFGDLLRRLNLAP